jgi:hypothetical protein
MLVERVDAHLTWRRVLTTGALSGPSTSDISIDTTRRRAPT